jgi:hypothetical protein
MIGVYRFMNKILNLKIADLSIAIEGDIPVEEWKIPYAYEPFIQSGKANIHLSMHRKELYGKLGKKTFDCPPIWTLYHQNGKSIIKIQHESPDLKRTLVLPSPITKADLYFTEKFPRFLDPFFGPTLELLMVHALAEGKGAIIHACGISRNGKGVLFIGESGAGKSTLSKLWDQEPGVVVLSDDRNIVRKKGSRYLIYGTPWHGDAKFTSAETVMLERIFFLRQGPENALKAIKGSEPVSRLLTTSFPPYWSAHGMAYTMAMFSDLTTRVSCQELTFRPDRSIIDFVLKELNH